MRASSPAPSSVIDTDLAKKLRELKAALTNGYRDEFRSRAVVAAGLLEIRNQPNRYGSRAMRRAAEELGRDVSALHRDATVAEQWPAEELAELGVQLNKRGEPLRWSHLVAVSSVGAPAERRALLKRALDEALSCRKLATAAKAFSTSEHASLTLGAKSLRQVFHDILRQAARSQERIDTWEQALDAESSDQVLAQELEDVVCAQEAQVIRSQRLLERLRGLRATSAPSAAAVRKESIVATSPQSETRSSVPTNGAGVHF